MATLSKASFLAKWQTLFADNTTRDISAEDMRDFRQDIADSFSNITDMGSSIPTGWNFATSGASPGDYPTNLSMRYYTLDDSVLPAGTEFWTNGSGGWYTK